jgi:hypothetical protein
LQSLFKPVLQLSFILSHQPLWLIVTSGKGQIDPYYVVAMINELENRNGERKIDSLNVKIHAF